MFFAIFITTAFCYLYNPKIRALLILSLSGVMLIAFRLSYLPIVLSGAVIVPGLAFFNLPMKSQGENNEDHRVMEISVRRRIITVCSHIIISCLLTYGLHSTYKIINGRLSGKPPAYQYCNGFHLLAAWTPLLEEEDFADPAIGKYTDNYIRFRLEDRFQRMNHRWNYYGLISYIFRMYDSRLKANKVANDTALNIVCRTPLGVIKLGWQSYMDYWDMTYLKEVLQSDRCTKEYPKELIEILKSYYHISGDDLRFQNTLTNQYFLHAIPWFIILFCMPLIIIVSIFMDRGRHLILLALLGAFALLILMNSTVLIHRNTMRFFHPNEWITILFIGVLFDRTINSRPLQDIGRRLRIIH
jgi:hypothetical protein